MKWIPMVKEKPKNDELVIAWTKDDWFFGKRREDRIMAQKYSWVGETGGYMAEDEEVTHWLQVEGPQIDEVTALEHLRDLWPLVGATMSFSDVERAIKQRLEGGEDESETGKCCARPRL